MARQNKARQGSQTENVVGKKGRVRDANKLSRKKDMPEERKSHKPHDSI